MVKRVVIELDDIEHEELSKRKGKKTWKQVLIEALSGLPEVETHE